MSTVTLDRAAEPTTQNGTRPPRNIVEVINQERRLRQALEVETERFERERAGKLACLDYYGWLRRCHRDGFDVERLLGAFLCCRVDGNLQAFSAEAIEITIQEVAECGRLGSRLNYGDSRVVPLGDGELEDEERDSVIYLLANLHRLPPLTEPQLEAIQAPHDPDHEHRLGAALNGLVERLRVNRVRIFDGLDFSATAALTASLEHAEAALEAWNPDPFQDM